MDIHTLKTRRKIFAKLLRHNKPSIVHVEGMSRGDANRVTITIFTQDGVAVYDTREVDLDTNQDVVFFDAPLDSRFYYQLIEHTDNSYDAINVNELDTFMDADIALAEAERRERQFGNEYIVAIRRL